MARSLVLAWSMLAVFHPVFAKTPVSPVPVGSPGDWIGSDDYPATALRFNMTGTTVFRLTVDATGKPSRCDITGSSGFDTLDTSTCERLMVNARFSPARDRAGKPVEGEYSNRVRWVTPQGASLPVTERFASMLLSIDQTGKVTSCRFVLHVPAEMATSSANPCDQALDLQQLAMGLELRGSFQGSSAEVEIRVADVFTPLLRSRVLSPMPGYEQRALNIHHFASTSDGKLGQCTYEEQRGSVLLATQSADFCSEAQRESFDPPFSAISENGVASGWHIVRILLKTGE